MASPNYHAGSYPRECMHKADMLACTLLPRDGPSCVVHKSHVLALCSVWTAQSSSDRAESLCKWHCMTNLFFTLSWPGNRM